MVIGWEPVARWPGAQCVIFVVVQIGLAHVTFCIFGCLLYLPSMSTVSAPSSSSDGCLCVAGVVAGGIWVGCFVGWVIGVIGIGTSLMRVLALGGGVAGLLRSSGNAPEFGLVEAGRR